MTEENSIWVIVEDAPEESETGGKGDGAKNPWSSAKAVTEKAAHSVRVSAATLQNRMSEFLQVVGGIFQRADRELSPQSAMQLEEIQLVDRNYRRRRSQITRNRR
ncbi:MAG: hypothetical protein WBB29_19885 [Geitlerinemataceae cyanobacterium]